MHMASGAQDTLWRWEDVGGWGVHVGNGGDIFIHVSVNKPNKLIGPPKYLSRIILWYELFLFVFCFTLLETESLVAQAGLRFIM